MITEKRYKIEQTIDQLVKTIADEHDAEYNFYGNCYPSEILVIENKLEFTEIENWGALLQDARDVFEGYL